MQELRQTKIIFLILSSDKYPSPLNEKKQEETWVREAENSGNKVFFYKGGANELLDKNYLYLNSGDGLKDIGYKTIDALKWVKKNYRFEYLVRSNSSTYVNFNEIEKRFVNFNSETPLYAGRTTNFKNQFNYAHGSCIILNEASVFKILEHEYSWDHRLIDDSALGKLFHKNDINLIHNEIFHVNSKILKGDFNKNEVAYRCKMELSGYPRYLDKYFIQLVHDNFMENHNKYKILFFNIVFNFIKFFNLKYIYLQYYFKIYNKIISYLPRPIKNFIKKILKKRSGS